MKIIARKVIEKNENLVDIEDLEKFKDRQLGVYIWSTNRNEFIKYVQGFNMSDETRIIVIDGEELKEYRYTSKKNEQIFLEELEDDMMIKTDFYIGRIDKVKTDDGNYRFDVSYLSTSFSIRDDELTVTDKELIEQNAYILEQID